MKGSLREDPAKVGMMMVIMFYYSMGPVLWDISVDTRQGVTEGPCEANLSVMNPWLHS